MSDALEPAPGRPGTMPRHVRFYRGSAAVAAAAGIGLTAAGSATVAGLLPYFTIQSTLAYGLLAGWTALRGRRADPVWHGAATLYVMITGLVFHLVLANPASGFFVGPVDRTPAEAVGNQLLHTVVPLLALADWLWFGTRRSFRPRYAVYWLAFPLAYLGFSLVRGLLTGTYPYPFIDVREIGYGGVVLSAIVLAVVFWVLGLVLVAIDRIPAFRKRPDQR